MTVHTLEFWVGEPPQSCKAACCEERRECGGFGEYDRVTVIAVLREPLPEDDRGRAGLDALIATLSRAQWGAPIVLGYDYEMSGSANASKIVVRYAGKVAGPVRVGERGHDNRRVSVPVELTEAGRLISVTPEPDSV